MESKTVRTTRLPLIDLLRALAVVAMVVYHGVWDLGFYGVFWASVLKAAPVWHSFARLIAGTFLVLSGISLVLASQTSSVSPIRSPRFWRRLAWISGAALLVTVSTWIVFPESYIFFGILHCIALSSLLALPFLRAPFWVALGGAVVALAAPFLVNAPIFEAPLLTGLGLGHTIPNTQDYVPLFPWSGVLLIGVTIGQCVRWPPLRLALQRYQPQDVFGRCLQWMGRHSLAIYLVHQPVLMGLLAGVALLVPFGAARLAQDAESPLFLQNCETTCTNTGSTREACLRFCTCSLQGLKDEKLWEDLIAGRINPQTDTRIQETTQVCQVKLK